LTYKGEGSGALDLRIFLRDDEVCLILGKDVIDYKNHGEFVCIYLHTVYQGIIYFNVSVNERAEN
jgi:hypothetical protein